MATSSNIVKKTAKSALKGNYLKSVMLSAEFVFAALIVYIALALLSFVFSEWAVNILLILFSLFIMAPAALGLIRAFWRIMWDSEDKAEIIFYYFSSKKLYKKALKLIFNLAFKFLWIGLLLLIPSIITDTLSSVKVYDLFGLSAPAFASNLWVLSAFLRASAFIILIAIMLKYYLAPFLFVADEDMDVMEAIHKSTVLTRATAVDFLILVLSFLGWILLSVLVIPLIFTLPYMVMSYVVHSRFAVANYNKVVKEFKREGTDNAFSADSFKI